MVEESQGGRSGLLVLLGLTVAMVAGLIAWRLWEYRDLAPLRRAISDFKGGNYEVALVALRPYAARGNVLARRTLGEMYAFGLGVPEDAVQARVWLRRAECGCDSPGQFEYDVALNYLKGYGGKQDKVSAFMWLRYAAESGHTRAQELVGDAKRLEDMGFSVDPGIVEYWKTASAGR